MTRRVVALITLVLVAAVPTIVAIWLAVATDDDRLLILAPSSLAPVESELDGALSEAGVGPVDWIFAGSQSLVGQVVDGAPADVVIVADDVAFEAVLKADAAFGAGTTFTSNHLVLAVGPGNPGAVTSLTDLADADLLIGLCAIEVPCGRLAAEALDHFAVTPRPDTEETSVRALTAKLASGELDAGLIYRSDAIASQLEVIVDEPLRPFTNDYSVTSNDAGRPVVDVLVSERVTALLNEAGFSS